MDYFSQYGQDDYLDNQIFKKQNNGVFIDIGAYDGKRLSNTYFFEKSRNWEGICFEPNPRVFKELIKNRDCICINGAVSEKEGELDFLDLEGVETLGGLVSKFDKRHLERIDTDFEKYEGKSRQIIKVKCYNINKVLKESNYKVIDYCSIDTEGGELDIVKSIDLSKFKVKVFSVENNFPERNKWVSYWKNLTRQSVEGYLKKFGYKKIMQIGSDDIYTK
jgi:FkbM family methyltransferase